MSTPTTPVQTASANAPQVAPSGGEGLGQLGRTTSSRGWLVLIALFLVVFGFATYGLFGTIPVQSTIEATVTNGTFPLQIPAGLTGTVASIPTDTNSNKGASAVTPAGTVILTIQPSSGGKTVAIKTPIAMGYSLDVIEGTPVLPNTVVAHGASISGQGSDKGKAQVYAFLGDDVVQTIKSAESMTVTPTAPSLAGTPAPIQISYIGSIPVSQQQIALLTGNTIYAQQAYSDAGGAPYVVLFKYLNATDADAVTGTAAAEITVTESTPHPLQLLFSQ